MRMTPACVRAARGAMSGSFCRAEMSFIMSAPALRAASATRALVVSIEINWSG